MSTGIKLPKERQLNPELVVWSGGSRRLAAIFQGRGIESREEIEHILNPLAQPEPDLSGYPPLKAALERITLALKMKEKVCVYGDYDVDGITATAVLVSALGRLGAVVDWHIPNRFREGYGMNSQRIRELAAVKTRLVITCDCGISNREEIELANGLGMDVIVTDHHTLPEQLPPALSIINFKLLPQGHPSRDLPGVGTAYVLARELLNQHDMTGEDLLDLVALGIIADVVPLLGHSRQLYVMGLQALQSQERPGLAALFSVANIQPGLVDEEKLGFQIAPRINAAGRLEDGGIAVKLLLAEDRDNATALARELDQLNSLRKELGRKILTEIDPEPGTALVAYNPDWNQGVLGIAAGQVCSGNQIPVILMTDLPQNGGIVGSARSVEGIDIYGVLRECQDYLEKFGGHPAAAGFSLTRDNLEPFMDSLRQQLAEAMAGWVAPELAVDLALTAQEINLELVEDLNRLAPCGEANPRPLIYCHNLTLKSIRPAGSGHILTLGDRRQSFSGGLWNSGPVPEPGAGIGAVFTLAEDIYRGQRSVWATIQAWWPGYDKPQLRATGYEYEDMRRLSWRQAVKKYPDASMYREGVHWQDYPGNTRNSMKQGETLLLLTAPPSPAVLRQVLAMAEPELVVLAYSGYSQNFLPEFLGAIKFCLNEGGVVSLPGLAAAIGYTEETVLAGLRVLAASEMVDYHLEAGKLILQRLTSNKVKSGPWTVKLQTLVDETQAYRKWMQMAAIQDIIKIKA